MHRIAFAFVAALSLWAMYVSGQRAANITAGQREQFMADAAVEYICTLSDNRAEIAECAAAVARLNAIPESVLRTFADED